MLYWAPLCLCALSRNRSGFCTKGAISTTGFGDIIRRDIELICEYLHFTNNKTSSSFKGTEELLKIFHTRIFQFDGSLRLWESFLHFQQFFPFKPSKFGFKTLWYLLLPLDPCGRFLYLQARTQHLTPPSSHLALIK